MVLLAAFKTLLHRHTQQRDILIGSPMTGRTRVETEDVIGFFVNTLPLRTRVSGDQSFRELLARMRETVLGACSHQDLPSKSWWPSCTRNAPRTRLPSSGSYFEFRPWFTSGLFQQIIDEAPNALLPLKQILTGGDVVSPTHIKRARSILDGCRLVNGYGPTENTTFTTAYEVPPTFDGHASVPIGRPIANTECYILDQHLCPVPIGVPGELCAGGDGLAAGYLNCPELTAERFVPNPFRTGSLLYPRHVRTPTITWIFQITPRTSADCGKPTFKLCAAIALRSVRLTSPSCAVHCICCAVPLITNTGGVNSPEVAWMSGSCLAHMIPSWRNHECVPLQASWPRLSIGRGAKAEHPRGS